MRTGSATPLALRRLRLVGVVLPALAIIALQASRPLLAGWWGERVADVGISVLTAAAAVVFGVTMFALIERGHRKITAQNEELSAVNSLLTAIARHENPTAVMDRVAAAVGELLGTDDCGVHRPGGSRPLPEGHYLLSAPLLATRSAPGSVWARRDRPASPEEQRLLHTMADLVSLSLAQGELLERERHAARADEVDRIAREMHDSLAQVLSALHLRLRVLEATPDLPPTVVSEIGQLAQLCRSSVQDVREGILGLRSLNRTDESFTAALGQFVRHHDRRGDQSSTVWLEGPEIHLPAPQHLHLLRIVQEALTNVRKHARATRTLVRLERTPHAVHVQVKDDGRGFDPDAEEGAGHFGLASMRERSELIGATLDVSSTPGRGTTVRVSLPLPGGPGQEG